MMDTRIEELLPFYALDALTDEERELVERYLSEHPEAWDEVREMRYAASGLPYGADPVSPSAAARQALMSRVADDRRARFATAPARSLTARPQTRRSRSWSFGFAALGVALAAGAIIWLLSLNTQMTRFGAQLASLKSAVVAQGQTIQKLTQSLGEVQASLPQTTPEALETFALNGTDAQPGAHGQLIANPASDAAVLAVADLAQLEPGKTYQVWLIQGQSPVGVGLLGVDQHGQGVLLLKSAEPLSSYDAVAISVEPEGGSLQPTGDIVAVGNLQ
jgi:anti-sigma-K factor RskA